VIAKEYMESMLETMASMRNRLCEDTARTYEVSDMKWIAAGNGLQLGWAEFVGGGIPVARDITSKIGSDHMRCKNQDGEDSTVVSLLLPRSAMERFKKEFNYTEFPLVASKVYASIGCVILRLLCGVMKQLEVLCSEF
jgi:hypothetical protein